MRRQMSNYLHLELAAALIPENYFPGFWIPTKSHLPNENIQHPITIEVSHFQAVRMKEIITQ
jgi:hypothetical protein